MVKRNEDQAPSTEKVLEAAIKAQAQQIEKLGGGEALLGGMERMSSADQRTIMDVIWK